MVHAPRLSHAKGHVQFLVIQLGRDRGRDGIARSGEIRAGRERWYHAPSSSAPSVVQDGVRIEVRGEGEVYLLAHAEAGSVRIPSYHAMVRHDELVLFDGYGKITTRSLNGGGDVVLLVVGQDLVIHALGVRHVGADERLAQHLNPAGGDCLRNPEPVVIHSRVVGSPARNAKEVLPVGEPLAASAELYLHALDYVLVSCCEALAPIQEVPAFPPVGRMLFPNLVTGVRLRPCSPESSYGPGGVGSGIIGPVPRSSSWLARWREGK